jgi:hypothetical protein
MPVKFGRSGQHRAEKSDVSGSKAVISPHKR